jgi:hypothetical protein
MNDIQPFDTIFYLSRTYFFSDPGNLFALYIQENYSEAIFFISKTRPWLSLGLNNTQFMKCTNLFTTLMLEIGGTLLKKNQGRMLLLKKIFVEKIGVFRSN